MTDNNIKGRLALITGASGGIGAACARDLAIRGLHLALTYWKNKNALLDVVSKIRALTPETSKLRISIHQVDLSQVDQITRLFDEIRDHHHKHIDILVSNAGYGKRIVNIWYETTRDKIIR
ncbi:putative 3-ketoacyl-acyl carrier protein reductase [Erysiphe neolycopersici]|uniref:Putative 3-ketoacyl-acyl carrier protein reductase n=1 Tax=Erysiphe neolycopersici TaxID=212602 RepID=A0A420HKI6_9PEZI|nr:putative 3-ketoacyl-acyl carrier protein reductase [Erysiphe neolycopersici]